MAENPLTPFPTELLRPPPVPPPPLQLLQPLRNWVELKDRLRAWHELITKYAAGCTDPMELGECKQIRWHIRYVVGSSHVVIP